MIYFWSKDEFVNIVQIWQLAIEVEAKCLIKALRVNKKVEIILIKLKTFCQQQGITIKYVTIDFHEEN